MADFSLDGRIKVKTLKANFKKAFGASLRVYTTPTCKTPADDEKTLAALRAEGYKGGELVIGSNLKVGNFEKKIADLYGIGVQVANADDTKLADNDITLSKVGCSESNKQSSCEVILVDAGNSTLAVYKAVRDLLIISLDEAMNLVRTAPTTLKRGITQNEAKNIAGTLKKIGAKVRIK